MKNLILFFTLVSLHSTAQACQYGMRFMETAKKTVEDRYGERVKVIGTDVKDHSWNNPVGNHRSTCPDHIVLVGKVHAILDGDRECVFTTKWKKKLDRSQKITRKNCWNISLDGESESEED